MNRLLVAIFAAAICHAFVVYASVRLSSELEDALLPLDVEEM